MKELKSQSGEDPDQRPPGERIEEDATQPGALPVAPGLGEAVDAAQADAEKEEQPVLTPRKQFSSTGERLWCRAWRFLSQPVPLSLRSY